MPESRVKTIHDDAYLVLIDCLRKARQDAGVTQTDLAALLGTDQPYISKYERSERRLDIIEVRSICQALGLDLLEFIASFEKELEKRAMS
jgi:transcriptional regulator with XRE-family HTH domain